MSYERRPDRRPGGRSGGGRQDRGPRERGGYGGDRPQRPGGFGGDRPQRPGGFRPRDDEGGMSIRLDPRRLSALKLLAAEAGMRPGELVTAWVEERLDAARSGGRAQRGTGDGDVAPAAFADLVARVDRLAQRLDALAEPESARPAAPSQPAPPADAAPRRRGRPPKASADKAPSGASAAGPRSSSASRVPLHEEIAAVIRERGPSTASEIASAIVERGRYMAPRSSRPLDAATVNSRVSNPAYRSRFARAGGRIDLA